MSGFTLQAHSRRVCYGDRLDARFIGFAFRNQKSATSLLDETCFRENVGLLAYSPLAFGQLSGKYVDNPKASRRLTIFSPTWSPRHLRPAVLAAVKEYAQLARANGTYTSDA